MLQYKSLIPATLELLKKLSSYNTLQNFYLVGGTALSLYLGHRISVDLDFFTSTDFLTEPILGEIKEDFRIKIIQQKEMNSANLNVEYPICSDEYIKVDFLKNNYPLINDIVKVEGLRLLSEEDIIPMKLSAIANRGMKKDFFDMYHILEKYSLKEIMVFFTKKYPDNEHFQIIKSLTYFEDAENDIDPISLKNITWKQVKIKMEKTVNTFL